MWDALSDDMSSQLFSVVAGQFLMNQIPGKLII
jgi:hypothetical protein